MCLHPQAVPPVPDDTARVARAAFPKGNHFLRMRDEFGAIYTDEAFVALFPSRGQSAESPWRLALVTIMQYVEGFSDVQAADAVRGHIDWKYALSLELTDPGFDASVLSEFRTRLLAGGAEEQLFDLMLAAFRERKLLKAHGRQRTDSTHVLAAIRSTKQYPRRTVTVRAKEQYEALQAARERQKTEAFKEEYAKRAGIEGTISQGVRAFGLRRSRYIGQAKTHLQHLITAAAINFVRVDNWLSGVPLAQTRQSAFVTLMEPAA